MQQNVLQYFPVALAARMANGLFFFFDETKFTHHIAHFIDLTRQKFDV